MPRLILNPETGELDYVDTGGGSGPPGPRGPQGPPGPPGVDGVDGADEGPFFPGVTDHHLLSNLSIDDHKQYLLLAGRVGNANDALLSLTVRGDITGSATAGFGLGLSAVSGATLSFGDAVYINPDITTISDPVVFEMAFAKNLTIDSTTNSPFLIHMVIDGGTQTWDVIGANGFQADTVLLYQPHLRSEVGVDQMILGYNAILQAEPVFTARGGNCTAGQVDVGHTALQYNPMYATSGGGTLAVTRVGAAVFTPRGDAGATLMASEAFVYIAPSGFGAVVDDIAFTVDSDTITPSGIYASLRSPSPGRVLQHGGPIVSATALGLDPTNASVGIELRATTRAVLLSRMTTAQRDALTAVDGMLLYNTDVQSVQVRNAGVWRSVPGAPNAPAMPFPIDGEDGEDTPFIGISAAQIAGGAALTKTDDTNVTLTLGGSPTKALLAATSLTLGWAGTLSAARGGLGGDTSGSTTSSTLRFDGTKWVASTALKNDNTDVTMTGKLTAQGSAHNFGTAGTACSLQVGQGTTGADNATLIVDCGNGGGIPALKLQANATDAFIVQASTLGIPQFGSATASYQFYNDTTFTTNGLTINTGKISRYTNIATEGQGVPSIYKSVITGTQTGAVTVASYTPPSTAGRYLVSVVITCTSSTNTGTVGVTLDYRDSQGTTQTGIAIPIHTQAATAIAATTTMAASKEFHTIPWLITINNAGVAIVVKTVVTGTVSYTAAAIIEQVA